MVILGGFFVSSFFFFPSKEALIFIIIFIFPLIYILVLIVLLLLFCFGLKKLHPCSLFSIISSARGKRSCTQRVHGEKSTRAYFGLFFGSYVDSRLCKKKKKKHMVSTG